MSRQQGQHQNAHPKQYRASSSSSSGRLPHVPQGQPQPINYSQIKGGLDQPVSSSHHATQSKSSAYTPQRPTSHPHNYSIAQPIAKSSYAAQLGRGNGPQLEPSSSHQSAHDEHTTMSVKYMEAHILQQDYQENKNVTSYNRPHEVSPSHPQITGALPLRTRGQTYAPHSVHSSSSDPYSNMHGRTQDGSACHQPALTQYPQSYSSPYAQLHGASHVHSTDASKSYHQVREHSSSRNTGGFRMNGQPTASSIR